MSNIAAFFRTWGWSLLIMAVIFAFSSLPSNDIPKFGWVDFVIKKGGHMTGYALLAAANLRALQLDWGRDHPGRHRARLYVAAFLIAVLYSVTDELHQSFVPGRHPAVTDIGIDSVGAATALLLWGWFQLRKQK